MTGRSIAARLPFYYGWVVVGVAFVTMSVGVSARTSFSLLFPSILDEFGWERGVTAGAFSIGFAASVMLVPTLGFVMTRFGPQVMIPAGAAITATGLVCATLATTPIEFYLTLGFMTVTFAVTMSYAATRCSSRPGSSAAAAWPPGSRSPASASAPSSSCPGCSGSSKPRAGGMPVCRSPCFSWPWSSRSMSSPSEGIRPRSGSNPTGTTGAGTSPAPRDSTPWSTGAGPPPSGRSPAPCGRPASGG